MALFFPPRMFTVDGNGLAMPGATLDFFITGTSTRQNTYSDSGLTTANANPVVADSNGLFGVIYLSTATDYKVVLKKSDGTTIFTVDPYFASQGTGRTAVNDVNYAATITDRFIAYTAITATRTITLPTALTFPAGTRLIIIDESGSASATKTLNVAPNGTDTINGTNTTQIAVNNAFGRSELESNGGTGWFWIPRESFPGLRSMLAGLGLTNDGGSPNTVLDIAAGTCMDSTNTTVITLAAITKSTGGAWAVGTGSNGMGTALTIANITVYHVFAIINAAVADVYFDTSVSAANKPSGTTAFRRIGSFITNASAQIVAFIQDGDFFQWLAPVNCTSATNPGTSAVTRTLASVVGSIPAVPTGVNVLANLEIVITETAAGTLASGYFSDLATTDTAVGLGAANAGMNMTVAGSTTTATPLTVRTNTSGQIRSRLASSSANTALNINVQGYYDRRGRDA